MKIASTMSLLLVLAWGAVSHAQVVTSYRPVIVASPVVVQGAAVAAPRRVVTYYPGQVMPAVHTAYQPIAQQQSIGSYNACSCAPAGHSAYMPVSSYGYHPGVIAYRPLLPISSMPGDVVIGRGIIGQPTAYVPGQPMRNFLRYLSP